MAQLSPEAPGIDFPYAKSADAVLSRLQTNRKGLSDTEADRRLAQFGKNALPPPRQRGPIARFLLQFNNVLIYVLLAAAVLTAVIGDWLDMAVIIGVVVINAVIGFIQEGKAEKAVNAIRRMLSLRASVLRESQRKEIAAENLVLGDIVYLQSGDKIPADLRLLDVKNLRVDEAALTGESEPVEKRTEPVAEESVLGDRFCMAYSGTLVVYGQATGVTVATGAATEIGRVTALLETVEALTTPLLRQMAVFGRWLTLVIIALSLATFAFGMAFRDYELAEMLLAVVGLAVAAIPEGLPAIMTIILAVGVQKMAAHKAIIRRLPAVETLGSVTVVCTDKTGTLTRNEMTVQSVVTAEHQFQVSGTGYTPHGGFQLGNDEVAADDHADLIEIARAGLLCNDAVLRKQGEDWLLQGDPTEGSLLALAYKAGLSLDLENEARPRTDTIPFESEHRFMATLHHDHEGHSFVYVKGAPERVLAMCSEQRVQGDNSPIDVRYWQARIAELADTGQRVLALASRPAAIRELQFHDVESGLSLLGLVGIIDPPREEAIESVRITQQAGIHVKMITGDHAATATAIARRLGIGTGRCLGGETLERMNEPELRAVVSDVDVFARASPEHKLSLVKALQAEGAVVAMTGDGVNDAPALKRADIGVAMGRKGTDAAKEASAMVLADDNFATITHAIKEGRTVYDNLVKSILFVLPTNGGQGAVILVAILLGLMLPITPIQILWVNMITAVTLALALAFEPPEAGVMQRPPRDPAKPLLSGFLLWRLTFVSLLLLAGALGFFLFETGRGLPVETARTMAVNALMVGEAFYLFSSRYIHASSFNLRGIVGNRYVLIAIAIAMLLQLLFTYAPFMQAWFRTAPLTLGEWARIFVFGLIVFLLVEAEKWVTRALRARANARGKINAAE